MEKELKDQWVAALRSGDIVQGHGVLRSENDEFCCLGVLANIVNPNGWEDPQVIDYYDEDEDKTIEISAYKFDQPSSKQEADEYLMSFITEEFAESLGITLAFARGLAWMNDKGSTFLEIATAIEIGEQDDE